MRKFRYTIIGFLLFFITISILVGAGIFVYAALLDSSIDYIAVLIFAFIFVAAALCTLIDYYRRKIMIEKPLNQILDATEQMSRGDFNIRLRTHHNYQNFDEFDYIKTDLMKLSEELSKNEVFKNDFIANISHEIKTPLSVIKSYAKILSSDKLSEDEKVKYLNNLQDACDKLSVLINNILKLNKLEHQKLEPEITRFNISELLVNQIMLYEDLLDKKELTLIADIDEGLYIESEESYLEIVFNNLMSNAIKFTDNKGTISVSLKKENQDFIIKFEDNGCGMNEETGKHIFDKFYQGDTSHSKEGNGLGLALVKKVIDIIGGTIKVKSEVGVGTTFIIVLKEK